MSKYTHYCIVRDDLPKGTQAAQLVHAAGESAAIHEGPLPHGTRAVVLAVSGQEKLLAVEKRLVDKDIPHHAVREPDAPYNGALVAIGVCPTSRKKVSKLLYSLPTLKEPANKFSSFIKNEPFWRIIRRVLCRQR